VPPLPAVDDSDAGDTRADDAGAHADATAINTTAAEAHRDAVESPPTAARATTP
jgi:hypothetical protein